MVGYDILAEYGIDAPNPFQKHLCYISDQLGYSVFVCVSILSAGFFIFEAETLQDYSDISYILLALINTTLIYAEIKSKCEIAFQLFEKIEEIIEKS